MKSSRFYSGEWRAVRFCCRVVQTLRGGFRFFLHLLDLQILKTPLDFFRIFFKYKMTGMIEMTELSTGITEAMAEDWISN